MPEVTSGYPNLGSLAVRLIGTPSMFFQRMLDDPSSDEVCLFAWPPRAPALEELAVWRVGWPETCSSEMTRHSISFDERV